ncbi:MAG: type II toxin-antitoxin system VapC family toxin [Planctomycetaceae bacterium]
MAAFLDTAGLIAVVHTRDQWHSEAAAAWQSLTDNNASLVTTNIVLIELGDGLSRASHRQLAVELRVRLIASPRVEIVSVDSESIDEAWEFFRNRPDKDWGMTDCISMTIMRQRNMTQVFTTDHHFEQAGFEVLIRK